MAEISTDCIVETCRLNVEQFLRDNFYLLQHLLTSGFCRVDNHFRHIDSLLYSETLDMFLV